MQWLHLQNLYRLSHHWCRKFSHKASLPLCSPHSLPCLPVLQCLQAAMAKGASEALTSPSLKGWTVGVLVPPSATLGCRIVPGGAYAALFLQPACPGHDRQQQKALTNKTSACYPSLPVMFACVAGESTH